MRHEQSVLCSPQVFSLESHRLNTLYFHYPLTGRERRVFVVDGVPVLTLPACVVFHGVSFPAE